MTASKFNPFPSSYQWINTEEQENLQGLPYDDPTRHFVAEVLLDQDEAFRHLARQCRTSWLVFVDLYVGQIKVRIFDLKEPTRQALEEMARVMPPQSGDVTDAPVGMIYYPDGIWSHVNGLRNVPRPGGITELELHGQLTGYPLLRPILDASRLLKPIEQAQVEQWCVTVSKGYADADALTRLRRLVTQNAWDADLFTALAEVLKNAGYPVTDLNDHAGEAE